MLDKDKIFKSFYTFATFSLIGTSAIYAKDSISIPTGTLIKDQQKLMNKSSKSTDSVNKIKGTLNDNLDLDLDFDFDKQRKSEDSIFNDIKDKAPYITMAVTPSLAVVAYSTFQKILEKIRAKKESLKKQNSNEDVNYKINENQGDNRSITNIKNNENQRAKKESLKKQNSNEEVNYKINENQDNNSSITDINNNGNRDNNTSVTDNNDNENQDDNWSIGALLVVFLLIIIIFFKVCDNDENIPKKAERDPINIKEHLQLKINENWTIGNKKGLNKYESRNSLLKGYIRDVYEKTGVGAHFWRDNNCFILSGIYTQFCISLENMNKEIGDYVNTKDLSEENKIKIFVSLLEERLEDRVKEEPNRFIWKQCRLELDELKNNKAKLKSFVTCALNVILMNEIKWDDFMRYCYDNYVDPYGFEQLEQENDLFGRKISRESEECRNFRTVGDQGSPADALGGMGIRLTDVGATGFDYIEKYGLIPENNFPYRQVLDRTSNFVTVQYDEKNGFKIVDKTWLENEEVTITLGKDFCSGPTDYKNATIAKHCTVNSTSEGNNFYDNKKSFIDENEKEQVKAKAEEYLKKLKDTGKVVGEDNKIVAMYEYVIKKDIESKERRFGSEALAKYALSEKMKLNGDEKYEKKLKNFTIEYNEEVDDQIPEDFQKKRMYIGAIGYVKGGAAGRGGHCQTLEPKYKWNNKKGYYEIVCWIDRDCLGEAGKVISNEEALKILREKLGKYNGRKDNTRAGACRLITEQVIDDCPGQYCFNGKNYNDANAKAEHTLESKKQLEEKRNKDNYETVQEINSVKDILEQIKREHPECFPGGKTPDEKNDNINNLLANSQLISN